MGNASQVLLSYVKETTYGTVPSGPPKLTNIRFTSEGLKRNTNSVESDEITGSRRIKEQLRSGVRGIGPIDYEMSYGSHDDFLQALLQSVDWVAEIIFGPLTTVSFDGTADTITRSSGSWTGVVPGGIIKTVGAATPANNGYFRVASIAGGVLTISNGAAIVTEAAGASITVTQGAYITDGTLLSSFVLEKKYQDLTNIFDLCVGFSFDRLSLTVPTEGKITGQFQTIGKDVTPRTATVGDGAPTAVNTNPIIMAEHATGLFEGGVSASLMELRLEISNGLRQRGKIGAFGPIANANGTLRYTGSIKVYSADNTFMTKYGQFSKSGIQVVFVDSAGKAIVIDMASLKYIDGQRLASGKDNDSYDELTFGGQETSDLAVGTNYMLRITRFA